MRVLIILLILTFSNTAFTQSKVEWLTFEEALLRNKLEQKQFMIDIYTDWCTWCKKMDKTTFSDPKVAEYINENYYAVKLNGESHHEFQFQGSSFTEEELAALLLNGNMSFPTTVFIWVKGDENLQANPLPVPGYQSKDKMHLILSFMHEAAYEGVSFEDYKIEYKSPYF
ncbi:thioredoxin family protein [Flammeovirga agarivorans]|uniref:DUF255 domain-containing protein n=1 Tax=Flammeovirga agarivorans TaxID=2726742 RepID=A0A7X8XWX4_9BACT|nr:DUF255 domain-containing protein [Flammeovirga agarivorans]NLR92525.1 DUF255 domain-containing protein [Flammeovirga agarivorans]